MTNYSFTWGGHKGYSLTHVSPNNQHLHPCIINVMENEDKDGVE